MYVENSWATRWCQHTCVTTIKKETCVLASISASTRMTGHILRRSRALSCPWRVQQLRRQRDNKFNTRRLKIWHNTASDERQVESTWGGTHWLLPLHLEIHLSLEHIAHIVLSIRFRWILIVSAISWSQKSSASQRNETKHHKEWLYEKSNQNQNVCLFSELLSKDKGPWEVTVSWFVYVSTWSEWRWLSLALRMVWNSEREGWRTQPTTSLILSDKLKMNVSWHFTGHKLVN